MHNIKLTILEQNSLVAFSNIYNAVTPPLSSFRTLMSPQSKSPHLLSSFPRFHPFPALMCSQSVDISTLNISCKWNHILCDSLNCVKIHVTWSCHRATGPARPTMAESNRDTVRMLHKKGPIAAHAKSRQAILVAQRRGDVETSTKWAAGQNKQHSLTKNMPSWTRKLRSCSTTGWPWRSAG